MRTIDLTNKTAIVTGSGQGIGLATVHSLHQAGANVVINYFADNAGNNLKLAEAAVSDLGERAIALPADVRSPDQLKQLVEHTVEKFGGLDILVNNAGILRDRSVKKMSSAEWTDVIDTNLTGVFNSCQAAIGQLTRRRHDRQRRLVVCRHRFFRTSKLCFGKSGRDYFDESLK